MNDQMKLILALQQVDNLHSLFANNEWEQYLVRHLTFIEVELKRQLSLVKQNG